MSEDKVEAAPAAPHGLDADAIGAVDDVKSQEIKVPEWGGSVWVYDTGALASLALDEQLAALPKDQKREAIWIFLAAVLTGPDGTRIFRDAEHAKQKMGGRQPKVLARIQREAMEFLGMEVVKAKND